RARARTALRLTGLSARSPGRRERPRSIASGLCAGDHGARKGGMRGRAARAMIRMIAPSVLAVSLLAPAPAAAAHTSAVRVFKASVAAPGQFDLTLAEVRFRGKAHAAGTLSSASRLARSIRLSLTGPSGLDYVAGRGTLFTVHRRPRILVLVVN